MNTFSSECATKVRRYNVWLTFKLDCCILTTTTTMSTDDRQRLYNMFCFCWLALYYDFDLNICAECPHFEAWKLKYVQAKSNVSSSIKFKFKWIKKNRDNKREIEGESYGGKNKLTYNLNWNQLTFSLSTWAINQVDMKQN